MPMVYNEEHFPSLHFHIEIWTRDGNHVSDVTCATKYIDLAHAAFVETAARFPDKMVKLRQWGRVIRQQDGIHIRPSLE